MAGVFVADVFDEQQDQDVVLVLAGIHAAAQFVAARPKGRIEFGFFKGHAQFLCFSRAGMIERVSNASQSSAFRLIASPSLFLKSEEPGMAGSRANQARLGLASVPVPQLYTHQKIALGLAQALRPTICEPT